MKITFNVTQEDIDKAGTYNDVYNCLGCICIKRVLSTNQISLGGTFFRINGTEVKMSLEFAYFLNETVSRHVKPKTFIENIPEKLLKKIGYLDDYTKENNEVRKLPQETKHQRHQMAEEESH